MLSQRLGPFTRHRRGRGRGGNQYAAVSTGDGPQIVDWYMEGKINIDDLITHTLPLEKINDGFALMKSGESIRSVVVY